MQTRQHPNKYIEPLETIDKKVHWRTLIRNNCHQGSKLGSRWLVH